MVAAASCRATDPFSVILSPGGSPAGATGHRDEPAAWTRTANERIPPSPAGGDRRPLPAVLRTGRAGGAHHRAAPVPAGGTAGGYLPPPRWHRAGHGRTAPPRRQPPRVPDQPATRLYRRQSLSAAPARTAGRDRAGLRHAGCTGHAPAAGRLAGLFRRRHRRLGRHAAHAGLRAGPAAHAGAGRRRHRVGHRRHRRTHGPRRRSCHGLAGARPSRLGRPPGAACPAVQHLSATGGDP